MDDTNAVDLSTLDTDNFHSRMKELGAFLHLDDVRAKVAELDEQMSSPNFWDDPQAARVLMGKVNPLKKKLESFMALDARLNDVDVLIEFAREEADADMIAEAQQEYLAWEKALADFELLTLLNGSHDQAGTYINIHAGAGGTEACDWAGMLLRMYTRWCERRGFEVTMMDSTDGDDAGIRSVTLKIEGDYAYGYLKNERGIHRLVRISPFDSAGKRHTSFASLDATPIVDDAAEIEVLDKDIRIDTYRSGGKGGQNVNKVETAVRITHIPSGVIVACQNERSQLRNREEAMNMLKAKLIQLEEDRKRVEADRQYSEKGDIAWGNQIRSYVFQPYQMVKDLRTGVESGNIQDVMDGNIDPFIEGMLRGHKRDH
ncbi:MAG: peptide chain release factor 2 [Akkermansia sp.]